MTRSALVKEQHKFLRGQPVGTPGESCATWPPVNFYLRTTREPVIGQRESIDPYRDTANPFFIICWTKDKDPLCPTFFM